MAGRDAQFERPPCGGEICGGICNVTAVLVRCGGGRSVRASSCMRDFAEEHVMYGGIGAVWGRTLEPSVPTSQSKARHDAKRGGNGRQDGDEDLQDFAPDGCFCVFHFV